MDLAIFHNYASTVRKNLHSEPVNNNLRILKPSSSANGSVDDQQFGLNTLPKSPMQFHPSTDIIAPTPTNFNRNRLIKANTSKGTMLFRVTVKKEVPKAATNTQIEIPQNESSHFVPIEQPKITATTGEQPTFVIRPLANRTLHPKEDEHLSRSISPIFCHPSPRQATIKITENPHNPHNAALYSVKSPDELMEGVGRGGKSHLLYDLNSDPTLSSTLSLANESGGFYETDYLFSQDAQMDDLEDESEQLNETFHSGIRGWESNDPTSTFDILAQIRDDPAPRIEPISVRNSPNKQQNQQEMTRPINVSPHVPPKRRIQRAARQQTPASRLELENLLASASVDPSKPVGCVLLEAGVGAEFHHSGRIKSTVNQPHVDIKSILQRTAPLLEPRQPATSSSASTIYCSDNLDSSIMQKPVHKSAQIIPCSHKGCSRLFPNKAMMRKHLLIHGPRQHICPICTRSFIERAKLKRHLVVHSGEKPFVCSYENCGKRFSLDFNLRTHIKTIHQGERQFICHICQKRFAQGSNLNTHLRFHRRIEEANILGNISATFSARSVTNDPQNEDEIERYYGTKTS